MSNISIIGYGSWGIALSHLLHTKGHTVRAWEYDTAKVEALRETRTAAILPGIEIPHEILITNDIAEACENADMIWLAVPSSAVRETAARLSPHVADGQVIVCVSKGLENVTLLRLSEVIEAEIPQCRAAVLSGPSHAEEVAREVPTTCVAASRHEGVPEMVQDCALMPYFRVYTSPDVVGVELGGALKNVIALAAGISDGIGCGDNTKAALMTRGITEIARLGVAAGANLFTFSGLTGIGDLIVTCTSMHSRNRRAGILLGQDKPLDEVLREIGMVVEGVHTARAAHELALRHQIEMPIIAEINQILFEGKKPRQAVMDLMTRDKAEELARTDVQA